MLRFATALKSESVPFKKIESEVKIPIIYYETA